MKIQITWTLDKETAGKVIARLGQYRKIDEHIAWILYRNLYENKPIATQYLGTVCDWFAATLWNNGAVLA